MNRVDNRDRIEPVPMPPERHTLGSIMAKIGEYAVVRAQSIRDTVHDFSSGLNAGMGTGVIDTKPRDLHVNRIENNGDTN